VPRDKATHMNRRVYELGTFSRYYLHHTLVVREIIVGQIVLICLGALAISVLEQLTIEESLYFAFITGLSVGFGDIAPQTTAGRIVSVAIALVGVIFVGLVVAVATRALADTVEDLRKKQG
jgi:hypothetical protein